jgi:hypothetical protein
MTISLKPRDEWGAVVHATREQIDLLAQTAVAASALLNGEPNTRHYQALNDIVDEFCNLNYIYPSDTDPNPRQDVWASVYQRILEIENKNK